MPELDRHPASGAPHARRSPVSGPALLTALLALLLVTPAGALPAPRLRALLQASKLAVAGQVTAVTSYDEDRAAVAQLSVETRFKGVLPEPPPPPSLAIAELHEGSNKPGLRDGARGLFFLRPATRNSYLTRTLPAASYVELLPDFGAFITADSPAELARQQAIMKRLVAVASGSGLTPATARTLTFELLACDNAILVEDAAAGVAELTPPLTDAERASLETALTRAELPERVRLALVGAVGKAKLAELAPTLRTLTTPPAVMEAAWQALDAMGAGLSDEALRAQLASPDAAARTAALRELLRRDGVNAIAVITPVVVQDPDLAVRLAGIDALGALKAVETLPPLERAFADNPTELRQHAARAILAVGGPPAVEALLRLSETGPLESQRFAALTLMTIDDPSKQAALRRIAKTHTDDQVRELVVHGLPAGEPCP
jgi:hypothetical protein